MHGFCERILDGLADLAACDLVCVLLINSDGRVASCAARNLDESLKRSFLLRCAGQRIHHSDEAGLALDAVLQRCRQPFARVSLPLSGESGALRGVVMLARTGQPRFRASEREILNLVHPHLENYLRAGLRCELCEALQERNSAAAAAVSSLTARERQVVGLIRDGVHTKEIASYLAICPSTVYRHVSNIFRKLDVRSRGELVALLSGRLTGCLEAQSPVPHTTIWS